MGGKLQSKRFIFCVGMRYEFRQVDRRSIRLAPPLLPAKVCTKATTNNEAVLPIYASLAAVCAL